MTTQTTPEMQEKAREAMNKLLSISRDSAEGYEEAAENVENQIYQDMFRDYAEQRRNFVFELTHKLNEYGETPDDGGSLLGSIHHAWLNLRETFTSGDSAVIAECNRGEEAAMDIYQEELQEDLPDDVLALIKTQYSLLKASYERVHGIHVALEQTA